MSAQQARIIEQQQRTIQEQHKTILQFKVDAETALIELVMKRPQLAKEKLKMILAEAAA